MQRNKASSHIALEINLFKAKDNILRANLLIFNLTEQNKTYPLTPFDDDPTSYCKIYYIRQ